MASRGELEQRVLELLWAGTGPMTVAAVHRLLQQERDLAYTTVMTVLDRLAKKQLVGRELVGRAWEYVPAIGQEELVAGELRESLESCPLEVQRQALRRFLGELPAELAEVAAEYAAADQG